MDDDHQWNPGREFPTIRNSPAECPSIPELIFTLRIEPSAKIYVKNIHRIAQPGSYLKSVAKWIVRRRLKRKVLGLSLRININSGTLEHTADESYTDEDARPGFHLCL